MSLLCKKKKKRKKSQETFCSNGSFPKCQTSQRVRRISPTNSPRRHHIQKQLFPCVVCHFFCCLFPCAVFLFLSSSTDNCNLHGYFESWTTKKKKKKKEKKKQLLKLGQIKFTKNFVRAVSPKTQTQTPVQGALARSSTQVQRSESNSHPSSFF